MGFVIFVIVVVLTWPLAPLLVHLAQEILQNNPIVDWIILTWLASAIALSIWRKRYGRLPSLTRKGFVGMLVGCLVVLVSVTLLHGLG